MDYQTITDEKLEEYLSIWKRHIEQNRDETLDFTLEIPMLSNKPITLTFGEEKRVLTMEQAQRFHDTYTSLAEKYGKNSTKEDKIA